MRDYLWCAAILGGTYAGVIALIVIFTLIRILVKGA
jgi:hypothetical protein